MTIQRLTEADRMYCPFCGEETRRYGVSTQDDPRNKVMKCEYFVRAKCRECSARYQVNLIESGILG